MRNYPSRSKEARKIEASKRWAKKKAQRELDGWTPKIGRKPRTELIRERQILQSARGNARTKNIDIDITEYDIIIPTHCPVLGFEINREGKRVYNSPSIDRINPNKGYVKGNIRIISWRANLLKNDMTLEECEKVLEDLRRIDGNKV